MNKKHSAELYSLIDTNGRLIGEGDMLKIAKDSGAIYLKAKFHRKRKRWFFYSEDTVGFAWEDLKLPQVKSVTVVGDVKEEGKRL